MLTFKTQFPIRSDLEMASFLDCCRDWIVGSPHSSLASSLPATSPNGVYEVAGERAEFISTKVDSNFVSGVRYEKTDSDFTHWTTEVVAFRTEGEFMVAVQLSVDTELPVESLGRGRRPFIVKLLMQRFGGGMDGGLPVHDGVIHISEEQQDLAADIICSRVSSVMPVVYVSRHEDGSLALDADQLAQWLSAMAHVVVEPSRKFSTMLSREVYGENPYGGAVAIFWPDGVGRWLYLPDRWESRSALQGAIVRKIRSSLLFQRTKRECTWAFVQEVVSRQSLEALRQTGSGKVEDYIAYFDKELADSREEVRRLEAELNRVKFSRWTTAEREYGEGTTIDLVTTERDLYQGEHLSVVLEALSRASESAQDNSRRRHVLDTLIAANRHEGEREMILATLKEVLSQYESMNSSVRKELEGLGFEIREVGKHYKLIFRNDERFPFILSRTSSDWRSGKNAMTEIRKQLF
ncbi:hypothetical protein MF545_06670 [Stenotrophomonas maltophilia]|nr:hypothetical protein [Stenotrophomonas maltophilia]